MKRKVKIFVGLDEPHRVAYDKCVKSIKDKNSKYKLDIQPINYNTVDNYGRKKDPYKSTQFAFARFFVPYQSEYKGVSVFLDGDLLFLESIDKLLDLYDPKYAIQCCKHDYTPTNLQKMDGKPQTSWPRKNKTSSVF